MITANFKRGEISATVRGLWQYDYGQVLRVQGLKLPTATEIHFALQRTGGESVTRVGMTQDGVTDATIPDSMLENGDTTENYSIYAFIYLTDENSSQTEYRIELPVTSRPKPQAFNKPEDEELFRAAIAAVNKAADRAENAETLAQSWAVGGTGSRDGEDTDNAKYYTRQAKDTLAAVSGAAEEGKKDIDRYVKGKEEQLKGDTGNVYFAAFRVVNGRLKMYSDPQVDRVRFVRKGSRLTYKLAF